MDGRVQIRNIWIKPQSVCETQRGGAHEFYVCCSHYQTRGRQCHGLGMFCWRKSWRSVSCSWYPQPTWLSQHGILQRHAIPSGLRLVGRSFVFQQDNDPKHTSNLCKNYLMKKENDGHLKIMTWPPQSPDLNPIELVWDELDRRAKAKQPTSAVDLWKLLQESWKNISRDSLVKLVN